MEIDIEDIDWIDTHHLISAAVGPKPIALVSTVGEGGVFNVAPYAFYGAMSVRPAVVYIGIGDKRRARQKKDTLKNIQFSKDFVINVVDEALAEPMNHSSADYPINVDEFKETGLTAVKSDIVKAPRVAESPISMECKLLQIMEFGEFPECTSVVLGEVLRVHVRDDLWVDNKIDMSRLKVIGGLTGELYCRTTDRFVMKRPDLADTARA